MAVRSSQNTITDHLLPGRDLLLQTAMRDQVSRYLLCAKCVNRDTLIKFL